MQRWIHFDSICFELIFNLIQTKLNLYFNLIVWLETTFNDNIYLADITIHLTNFLIRNLSH